MDWLFVGWLVSVAYSLYILLRTLYRVDVLWKARREPRASRGEAPDRAKKTWECAGCGAVIQAGQRYRKTFMVFEGEPSTSRHCLACERDISAFAKAHEHQMPHPATLVDVVIECIEEAAPNEIRRWQAMLARIRARRMPESGDSVTRAGSPRSASASRGEA